MGMHLCMEGTGILVLTATGRLDFKDAIKVRGAFISAKAMIDAKGLCIKPPRAMLVDMRQCTGFSLNEVDTTFLEDLDKRMGAIGQGVVMAMVVPHPGVREKMARWMQQQEWMHPAGCICETLEEAHRWIERQEDETVGSLLQQLKKKTKEVLEGEPGEDYKIEPLGEAEGYKAGAVKAIFSDRTLIIVGERAEERRLFITQTKRKLG